MADPETWEGEWVEKRWTPLSRAIDRGLDSIVMLFRDALNAGKHAQQQQGQGGRMPAGAATTKNLIPQGQPPINSNLTEAPFMQNSPGGGPSTSSNEGAARNAGTNHIVSCLPSTRDSSDDISLFPFLCAARGQQQQGLVLGGVLDSPYDDEGGLDEGMNANMHQQMMNTAQGMNQRTQQQQQQHLHHAASMPPQQHQQQVPLRERAPGGMSRGPSMYGPAGGNNAHGHSAASLNIGDLKIRDHRDRDGA